MTYNEKKKKLRKKFYSKEIRKSFSKMTSEEESNYFLNTREIIRLELVDFLKKRLSTSKNEVIFFQPENWLEMKIKKNFTDFLSVDGETLRKEEFIKELASNDADNLF